MTTVRTLASTAFALLLSAGMARAQTDTTSKDPAKDAAQAQNPHDTKNKDRDAHPGMDAMMKNATPATMVQKLHHVNQKEIEMGKLAQSNGTSRAQDYGKMLVSDHQDADRELTALAKKKNLDLSQPMDKVHEDHKREMQDKLASLHGADFDKELGRTMADGHKRVLALVQAWRSDCKDPELCAFLDKQLPVLQKHLRAAEQLSANPS